VKDIVGLQPEVQEFVHVRLVGLAPLVVLTTPAKLAHSNSGGPWSKIALNRVCTA